MTEQLRIWAGLQGFLSLAALVALALFFALAAPFASAPRTQWMWLGPVNDWLSVIGAPPWIVAMVLLSAHVRVGAPLWAFTAIVSAGVVALAVVTLLMLSGRVSLQVQSLTAVPVTILAFVWIAVAAAAARAAGTIPLWVSVLATVMLIALLIGAAAGGAGYLLPTGSGAQSALYIAAAGVGGLAWFAFPAWWLAVASTAR